MQEKQSISTLTYSTFFDTTTPTIKCINHQLSKLACLNKKCTQNAFVCENQFCSCRNCHPNCLMIQTKTIKKALIGKITSAQSIFNCLQERIEIIIGKLSNFRQKQLQLSKRQKLKYYGLNKHQKQFLDNLNKGAFQSITGSLLWKAHLDTEQNQQYKQLQNLSIKQLNNFFDKITQQITNYCNVVSNYLQLFEKQYQNIEFNKSKILCNFQQSKILRDYENQEKIQMFFGNRIISQAKLIYRASQNNFQIKNFHQKCDGVAHTLIICETEYNKKIGGYTPVPWEKSQYGKYSIDQSSESFIFSLSNGDKFPVQKKQSAIYHYSQDGPNFGSQDFHICDQANRNNSFANINTYYFNNKYRKDSKKSWENFCGNPNNSCKFKVKEWEVWKLQFFQIQIF